MATVAKFDVDELTVEKKASLCTGASAWTTVAIESIGLPAITVSDGPHGLRRVADDQSMAIEALPATCFPTASSTASTWDPALLRELGVAIAEEAIQLGVDVVLGPGINIKRSPLCGRNFEYFSEDPYLTGELAVGFIEGVQSLGVGTSLKHFAVNNQETRRMSVSAELDERTLREIYLAGFETAVKRARPWTVMCSYNRINGTYASEHRRLLVDILRAEWGFDGLVVSDWNAVHDRVKSLEAGLDLQMPGPRPRDVDAVVEAIHAGKLDESTLSASASRVADLVGRVSARVSRTHDVDEHHALARRIASAGMVLVKNDGVLPLKPGGHIAVIGRGAKEPPFQGGGSSRVVATKVDVPLDEIARLAGGATIEFADGCSFDGPRPELMKDAVDVAARADLAVVFLAAPEPTEGRDRTTIDLPPDQVALVRAICKVQPRSVVIVASGSVVSMADWIDGTAAVLLTWLGGQAVGGAIADVLFGIVSPSGRLPETFPRRLADTPAYLDFPGDGDMVRYAEGLFVGYRWFDARAIEAQFAFGHGLSYTTFEYGSPRVSAQTCRDVDGVTVAIDVTNTGTRRGAEVVQLYVRDVESSLRRPVKELKGFAKVFLEPGQRQTVEFELDYRSFAFYSPVFAAWMTEDGSFELLIGASSTDIRASASITLESTFVPPPTLSSTSTLGEWLAAPRGGDDIHSVVDEITPILAAAYGMESVGAGGRPEFPDYLTDMPLRDVLEFAAAHGGPDPDVILARLPSTSHGDPRPGADGSSAETSQT